MTTPIVPVVLCGGSGTRLWPLSRKSLPKQFVPVIKGKNLLQLTFERLKSLDSVAGILTVANLEYRFLVQEASNAAGVSTRNILEPVGRNTAPAMAAAALNSSGTDLLLFLPADHYIADVDGFSRAVQSGLAAANSGKLVVFGVKPLTPSSDYGYIRFSESPEAVKPVRGFVEKPGHVEAVSYLGSGDYCWNAGIFLVRADVLLKALNDYAPDILHAVEKAVSLQRIDGNSICLDPITFGECRSDSIDYSVLEKYSNIGMVALEGGWSDVGNWSTFAELIEPDQDGNRLTGLARIYDSKSSYVHAPHRPIVVVGLDELLVVDTADALLIASKSKVERVKDIVSELQLLGVPQATEHRYSTRPWGRYEVLDEGDGFKVKRITVNPESSLSLQVHRFRAEHWVVVRGTAKVTRGEEQFVLQANQSAYIPSGTKHRLENAGEAPLEIIEVQSGDYLGEDDIERFDDHYGRA